MRIAQVAPLTESVPPTHYGGTERIVSYLTDQLVAMGHEVTLFASGDSRTTARLVPCSGTALRSNPAVRDPIPHHMILLEEVRRRADEFDVVHFHIDLIHAPLARALDRPSVTTLHGRLDLPDLQPFYGVFSDLPLVSISDAQRLPMPPVNWLRTVHHGLPPDLLRPNLRPKGDYLAFLGRISPEKRPDLAIEIARRAGLPLRIAAKVDQVDLAYWHAEIEPLIAANREVEFIGEIGEAEKQDFLGNARALVFPIDWPEPFGLVMIEAMACGTPIIASNAGSVAEIVTPGESGMVVDTIEEAVAAVGELDGIDRAGVRAAFDRRFTSERMAEDYLAVYWSLLDPSPIPLEVRPGAGTDSAPVTFA